MQEKEFSFRMYKGKPKTCDNCGYRKGWLWTGGAVCALSGYYCSVERKYPTKCGRFFENWIPRK